MAKFIRLDKTKIDYLSPNYIFNSSDKKAFEFYLVEGRITEEDVKKINRLNSYTILILKNTKEQDSQIIRKIISPNVKFSIVGGLDYINKRKFNDSHYILRTLHYPHILAKIIEYFEKIEKGIRYTWTDIQKCMYIYKTLTELLHYKYDCENDYENGRDVVRSLEGVLYGKLVCSGFALVFKEAMDRVGIPCIYQNRINHHSWNIVKLNGKNVGVELTWDCYNKGKNNTCQFAYFGRDSHFYEDKHHDISCEIEEQRYTLSTITESELSKDMSIITNLTNVRKEIMLQTTDISSVNVYYILYSMDSRYNIYLVQYNNKNNFVILENSKDIQTELKKKSINKLIIETLQNPKYLEFQKDKQLYRRKDGSEFFIKDNKVSKNGVNDYYYFDILEKDGKRILRRAVILSEMDLIHTSSLETDMIANNLLGKDRLGRKINYYHGYVGYFDAKNNMLYNRNFEEQELGIKIRK